MIPVSKIQQFDNAAVCCRLQRPSVTYCPTDALSLAVKQVSNGVFTFYNNDNTGIGLFPEPYDWSQSGAAWDSLVNYWYLTGDTSHNAATQAALSAQTGPDDNYLVPNQTISEGNENRTVWGLAALTAAERNFPQADGQGSSWEDLARNVFDGLAPRWDTQSCGGGLRSQIFTFNSGYNWKNSASQALFFQLAARLAHFTGNQTYVYWASRTYNWTRDAGLIGDDFAVYDGASANDNCSNVSGEQWSYTAASFAYGSAVLANFVSIDVFHFFSPLNLPCHLLSCLLKIFFFFLEKNRKTCLQRQPCDE